MLKIENIKLEPGHDVSALFSEAAHILKLKEKEKFSLKILRRSIDAREDVKMVYTVEVEVRDEETVLKRCRSKKVSRSQRKLGYVLPAPMAAPTVPP